LVCIFVCGLYLYHYRCRFRYYYGGGIPATEWNVLQTRSKQEERLELSLRPFPISTSFNRRSENVGVFPVVIPELELGDIEMQVFLAKFVIGPNDTALKNRPKALNRLSVDCPDNVLTRPVVNGLVRIFLRQLAISGPLVSCKAD
jgi:hypothetical protein